MKMKIIIYSAQSLFIILDFPSKFNVSAKIYIYAEKRERGYNITNFLVLD